MKITTHESDLYCLPENTTERLLLQKYVEERSAVWSYSNVEGQGWYGKMFLDIPFGSFLKAEIEAEIAGDKFDPKNNQWKCGKCGQVVTVKNNRFHCANC